ncbi:hypothetical protein [Erwinia oleae]|nr:hypothetical protein [Erwinia oleae]
MLKRSQPLWLGLLLRITRCLVWSGLDGFGTGFQNNVQAQGSLVNNTNHH